MFELAMMLGALGLVVVVLVLRASRGGARGSGRDTDSGSYLYADSGGSGDASDCADGGGGSDGGGCDGGGGGD
jgi:hypothetical protein